MRYLSLKLRPIAIILSILSIDFFFFLANLDLRFLSSDEQIR